MGAAGALWRRGTGWPRAIAVGLLAASLVAEGIAFGAQRIIVLSELTTDPGALLLAAEAALGVTLPALLLRRREWLRGYLATAALAVLAALTIGPVTTALRGLADHF